jgi:hypothetical protein
MFYRCLAKAGLRRVRIHDLLRHAYASLLLQQGESLAYTRDQLGHHSIQVTVDIYGPLVPGGNHAAVYWLDDDAPIRNLPATAREVANHAWTDSIDFPSALGRIWTCDLRIRNPLLYPPELREHTDFQSVTLTYRPGILPL